MNVIQKFLSKLLVVAMLFSYLRVVPLAFAIDVEELAFTTIPPESAYELEEIDYIFELPGFASEDITDKSVLPVGFDLDFDIVQIESEVEEEDDTYNVAGTLQGIMGDVPADVLLKFVSPEAEGEQEFTIELSVFPEIIPLVSVEEGIIVSSLPVIDEKYTVVYQWNLDGVPVDNATEPEMTPTDPGSYTLSVWLKDGSNTSVEFLSDPILVELPELDTALLSPKLFRAGEKLSFVYDGTPVGFESMEVNFGENIIPFELNTEDGIWESVVDTFSIDLTGIYTLTLKVTDEDGFTAEEEFDVEIIAGIASDLTSTLNVIRDSAEVTEIEVGSDDIEVVFVAKDRFGNLLSEDQIDNIEVRFQGVLLDGVDIFGVDSITARRDIVVPTEEDLSAAVTVDVFDDRCDGDENYCFSMVKNLMVYEPSALPVYDLGYEELTTEGTAIISGKKMAGYGVKLNFASAEYTVLPDNTTEFVLEVPLTRGLNRIDLIGVKPVGPFTFYSVPVEVEVTMDDTVTAPEWGSPAVVLSSDNEAELHWTDPIYLTTTDDDFSHVNIYRSTVPNFVPSEYNLIVATTNPSWTDTGLTAGVNYYYKIEAVDNLGNSNFADRVVASGAVLGQTTFFQGGNWVNSNPVGKGTGTGGGGDVDVEGVEEDGDINGDAVMDENGPIELSTEDKPDDTVLKKVGDITDRFAKAVSQSKLLQVLLVGVGIFFILVALINLLMRFNSKIMLLPLVIIGAVAVYFYELRGLLIVVALLLLWIGYKMLSDEESPKKDSRKRKGSKKSKS